MRRTGHAARIGLHKSLVAIMRIYSIIIALAAVLGPAYAKPLAASDVVSVDCSLAIAAALVQVQEDRLFGAMREENFAAEERGHP